MWEKSVSPNPPLYQIMTSPQGGRETYKFSTRAWPKAYKGVKYDGMLVPVRTSFNLRRRREKRIMYQLKVDVDKLNAVKVVVN